MSAERTIRRSALIRLGNNRWTDRQRGYTDADGNAWEFTGRLFNLADVTVATIKGSSPWSFTIRDDDAGTWKAAVADNSLLNLDVELHLLEDADPPRLVFKGHVLQASVDGRFVSVRAGSFLRGLDTVRYYETTPESQERIDAADRGYDNVANGAQDATPLVWRSDT